MKTISNFHTHSKLCGHAQGMPLDYVQQALKEGCTALGFSDHCPYHPTFNDTWDIRMSVQDTDIYINSINEARESAPFPVYLGYECEWDSDFSSWYSDDLRSKYKAEYLILGSHWVTVGSLHIYVLDIDNNQLLNKYIDQTIQGMASKNFAFLAHPDLFMAKYKQWDSQAEACSRALIEASIDLNLPLEINGLGMSRPLSDTKNGMRFAYPYAEFWELAASLNAKIICNSDAHNPQDVIFNAYKAHDFASRFNLSPISSIF